MKTITVIEYAHELLDLFKKARIAGDKSQPTAPADAKIEFPYTLDGQVTLTGADGFEIRGSITVRDMIVQMGYRCDNLPIVLPPLPPVPTEI